MSRINKVIYYTKHDWSETPMKIISIIGNPHDCLEKIPAPENSIELMLTLLNPIRSQHYVIDISSEVFVYNDEPITNKPELNLIEYALKCGKSIRYLKTPQEKQNENVTGNPDSFSGHI